MRNRITYLFICFLMPIYLFGQKGYVDKINQFNPKGQKEGYWIEDRGFDTIELYYKNGRKSGVFKSYSKQGTLSAFGEYLDGQITGTWFYFGDKGHLMGIQRNFMVNKDTVILDSGKRHLYPYKCYSIYYYPNGNIRAEGILLWNDDPEMDDAREYGEWKYYDEIGKLVKTEQFN